MYKIKERNCKGSVSSIVKSIEWTLLHGGLDTFTQVREKERKKKEKKKKDCWETFLFDVFLLA